MDKLERHSQARSTKMGTYFGKAQAAALGKKDRRQSVAWCVHVGRWLNQGQKSRLSAWYVVSQPRVA